MHNRRPPALAAAAEAQQQLQEHFVFCAYVKRSKGACFVTLFLMADVNWDRIHHFPQCQGDESDVPSTQAMFDSAFSSALAELPEGKAAASSNCEIGAMRGPCGFIALATAITLARAVDEADGERLARDTGQLFRRIQSVITMVLQQRVRVLGAQPPPASLGKDVTPELYLTAMMGQWEVTDAVSSLASTAGTRLCFLRNTFATDDEFFVAQDDDPLWVRDYFATGRDSRWGACKHFMQDGAELLSLDEWAANAIASGASVTPPFVVDTLGHYFVARVRMTSFRAIVYDSYARHASEPLDDHVCDVVDALKKARQSGAKK
jgi:hypothetical protein